jgi:phage shock protein C
MEPMNETNRQYSDAATEEAGRDSTGASAAGAPSAAPSAGSAGASSGAFSAGAEAPPAAQARGGAATPGAVPVPPAAPGAPLPPPAPGVAGPSPLPPFTDPSNTADPSAGGIGEGPAPAGSRFTFRRSRTDRMLGGVCGGLAQSLGVDAALLRIGLVVLTVLGFGLGAVAYVAAWILAPEQD